LRPSGTRTAGSTGATLRRPEFLAFLLLALAAAGAIYFVTVRPVTSRRTARDSILLVTLDTTRADHVGAYGYRAARTPHLDRLAAEGTRFASVTATAPLTLPAHASLLTGLYPPEHGVRNNGNFRLPEGLPTVATVLQARGYRTAAFVSAFVLDRRFGLARGFETYDDSLAEGGAAEAYSFDSQRAGDKTGAALVRWLESLATSPTAPFFAWLHLYDPHEPYAPPAPFQEAFATNPYDGEIAFADQVLGTVREALIRLRLEDRVVVVVAGDHGESLGEHGEETHSMFVYEGAVQVPLVFWGPGRIPAGRVVGEPVSGIDIAPTLVELAAAPPLPPSRARSLLPLMEGKPGRSARILYTETLGPQLDMGWAPLRSVRDDRYKLIEAPRPELFDLSRDKAESTNLYDRQPSVVAALRAELETITGNGGGSMSVMAMSREVEEKLAALGYVGTQGDHPPAAKDADLTDPKDVIQIFNRLRRASTAVLQHRPEEALVVVAEVDRMDPGNAFARFIEANARMALGQYAAAIPALRAYLAERPRKAVAHHLLGIACLRTGDQAMALREAEAALGLEEHFVEARVLRGRILLTQGKPEEAVREFRRAVEDDPDKPVFRLALARTLEEVARPDEAMEQYRALLARKPEDGAALAGLGALVAGRGDVAAARELLRRALAADPDQHKARFILAQILESEGRRAEASAEYARVVETLRHALAAEPERYDARLNLARVLERQGKTAEAAQEYGRLAAGRETPPRLRALARERLARGRSGS
jgi:arylsulfatase A-like enzyme/tetratricopeptide (TPR) repeat protein